MDFYSKFNRQIGMKMTILFLLPIITIAVVWLGIDAFTDLKDTTAIIIAVMSGVLMSIITIVSATHTASQPVDTLQQIITYSSNSALQTQAPDTSHTKLGKELIESLERQIYDLASSSQPTTQTETVAATPTISAETHPAQQMQGQVIDELSIPVIGVDAQHMVTVANKPALDYFQNPAMVGKHLDNVMNLSFQSDEGLEQWLQNAQQTSVTAQQQWTRVRHTFANEDLRQFDLAANYTKDSSSGLELLLAIHDKTTQYNTDDQELSLVALAVHELRTPLTVMRGYIEVFQDELGPTLTPEMTSFMHKMQASSQQLAAFVGNILNVARVQENQLSLTLHEGNWSEILTSATNDLQLRARVHGIALQISIADNLPTVGVDKLSAHEVINNLVDNAIKYSNGTDKIIITATVNDEGMVETSVQDFGIGIPTAVMGTLFQKYHRSHTSKTQVSGTGLGLYLCKALVTAHGGNIWVRSKENEGSIFSFTLMPYSQLSQEQIAGQDGIVRGAHGWIKNHSLYRS